MSLLTTNMGKTKNRKYDEYFPLKFHIPVARKLFSNNSLKTISSIKRLFSNRNDSYEVKLGIEHLWFSRCDNISASCGQGIDANAYLCGFSFISGMNVNCYDSFKKTS